MAAKRKPKPERDDPRDELARLAQELSLTTLTSEELSRMLEQAERDEVSYSDFALRMLQHEVSIRKERKLNRNLKRSRLGTVNDRLEDFDFSCRPKLQARVVRELLNCRWVEEARNVICVGRPGLGKTRILRALGRAACNQGYSVLYVHTAELLEDLHASLADGSYKRAFRRYQKPTVLVCDEFGYEPFDSRATSYLFRLVSARHGVASTLLAANTGFKSWKTFFPSEAQAVATVDRLIDQATILHFTGKSHRKPQDHDESASGD